MVFQENDLQIQEEVNAQKNPLSGNAVETLLEKSTQIFVASGQKVIEFFPTSDNKEEILKKITGRTGNLRAPSLSHKNTLYVGFNAALYEKIAQLS